MEACIVPKIIALGILGFIFWLVLQCPCQRLLCCHLGTFWLAILALFGVVIYENGFKIFDPSCWK